MRFYLQLGLLVLFLNRGPTVADAYEHGVTCSMQGGLCANNDSSDNEDSDMRLVLIVDIAHPATAAAAATHQQQSR